MITGIERLLLMFKDLGFTNFSSVIYKHVVTTFFFVQISNSSSFNGSKIKPLQWLETDRNVTEKVRL